MIDYKDFEKHFLTKGQPIGSSRQPEVIIDESVDLSKDLSMEVSKKGRNNLFAKFDEKFNEISDYDITMTSRLVKMHKSR